MWYFILWALSFRIGQILSTIRRLPARLFNWFNSGEDCSFVEYHVTAFQEKFNGRWRTSILTESSDDIDKVTKLIKKAAVKGADTIVIEITRTEGNAC